MGDETKPVVSKEDTFDRLDIRLGQVLEVQVEPSAPKRAYRLTVDFGRFGKRTSVGRFTGHTPEEIQGKKVLGVLNSPHARLGPQCQKC